MYIVQEADINFQMLPPGTAEVVLRGNYQDLFEALGLQSFVESEFI